MLKYKNTAIAFLASFLFLMSMPARAQVALNAPPEDPVYRAVDTFIAHGLVNDVIVGQRPFSRLEIARILRVARQSLDDLTEMQDATSRKEFSRALSKKRYLDKLLSYYEREYEVELKGMESGVHANLLREMEYGLFYNSSAPRRIPVNNGQAFIDGMVTSFDRYGRGLTYVYGTTNYIATKHDLYLTKYLALTAQPQFIYQIPRSGNNQELMAQVHRLYLKSGISNFEFEIGRDNLLWGQGEYGGLLASSNPRPLDMIKLSNPYPLKIPYVGGMKFTLFVSNLGPEQYFKYSYFYGFKWSWRPVKEFEFGLSHTVTMGGDGAPGVKWWEPIAEIFPIHKWGGKNIGADDVANNAFGLLEFRFTIPPLRSSVLYTEAYIEDSVWRAFRLPDNLLNQMAFIAGWYMPRLTSNGDFALRLEYHHVPPVAYRHVRWQSGYTLDGRVIGDPLGPTADGVYATLYWRPNPKVLARLDFAYEDYDSSTYITETNSYGGGDRIVKDVAGPHEHRFRMLAGLDLLRHKRMDFKFAAGYEYIDTWNFQPGVSRNNLFLMGKLTLHFDEFSFSSR